MCAWKRWESCSCSDRVAALLFDILSLYYIQTVLSCFCASQYYIFVLYCKFPIINKMSSEGIYTSVCTQVYLFFWYADLFFDTSRVRRWKVEDDRRRKTKWLSYSWATHVYFFWVRLFLQTENWMCVPRTRLRPTSHLDWLDLQNLYKEQAASCRHYCLQCNKLVWRKGAQYSDKLPTKGNICKEMHTNRSLVRFSLPV